MDKKPFWLKLLLSIVLVIVCIASSAIFYEIILAGLKMFDISFLGLCIGAVIIAPMVEETSKRISLINGFPWFYFVVFTGAEAFSYVINMLSDGIPVNTIVLARSLAAMMHLTTVMVQIKFKQKYDERGRIGTNWEKIGFYNAICIHACWNAFCLSVVNV